MSSNEDDELNKTLMSSNEDDNDKMNQNNKNIIKQLSDCLDKIIDKSKSFKDQIKLIRKEKNLDEYYFINDYGDKELEFKIFKLQLAYLSNMIDKKIFKQIMGRAFETLTNKLINTTNKEENQIIVNNIKENKEKLYEEKEDDYVIQPSDRLNNLIDAIDLILDFNETIQLDLVWKFKNQRIKKWASDFNWWKQSKLLSTLCHQKKIIFFLCKYKMVLKITKEIWEKCGIKTVKYYNKKESIIEWCDWCWKMSGAKNEWCWKTNRIFKYC